MKPGSIFAYGCVALFVLAAASPAFADTSIRHLVYTFSYGTQQNATARDSATISMGSNISHYGSSLGDKGTMTVDVIREQPDHGLIVTIGEQGENTRRTPPAECVVYGNTAVICDPNKTVNQEEYTLLRFLAANFVDPNQLDAKQHWAINQGGQSMTVTADYVIESNANGVMTIGETRTIKQRAAGTLTTDVQTKIGYDFTRLLPTAVDEYATQRQDAGMSGTSITTYQTTLKLLSDSIAKP